MLSSSFWIELKRLRDAIEAEVYVREEPGDLGLPIHPSASELAEDMLVDPDALRNETYEPGIYDENGDYYPQFTDDPSKLPDYIAPNPLGDTVPASAPASDVTSEDSSQSTEGESESN